MQDSVLCSHRSRVIRNPCFGAMRNPYFQVIRNPYLGAMTNPYFGASRISNIAMMAKRMFGIQTAMIG